MYKKYYFILNPAAGQGTALELKESINELSKSTGLDIQIYETREELDGQLVAREIAKNASEQCSIRIYPCGGDGTLNEVVNGIIGFKNVEIGIIPTGTGNDFIRNFGKKEIFENLKAQIYGDSIPVDTIKYKYFKNNYSEERHCINMINIGFDSRVVEKAGSIKKFPGISGNFAYTLGVLGTLWEKKDIDITVESDSNTIFKGKSLLIAIGNGGFCGGGINALPKSNCQDGMMDIGVVSSCKRRDIAKLFGKYKTGEHLETKLGKKIVTYSQNKAITIKSNSESDLLVSVDGELVRVDSLEAEVVSNSVQFIIPKKK